MLRLLPTTILFLTAAFLSFATHLQADIAVFDFEGAPGDGVHDGDLSTLSLTESGLTVTITRTSGLPFDVLNDVAGGFPDAFPAPGWDDQALSPFFAETANDRFLVNFSLPVDLFGVQTGDFGGDDDDLILQAFSGLNGTGTLIDTTTDSFTGDFNMTGPGDGPQNLVVFGSGIQSVTFGGGSTIAPHSVFFDNFRISFVVPEPSSAVVVGLAILGMAVRRRRG